MSKVRKDNKGRILRRGESQRKSDLRYIYQYYDPYGNRHMIYETDLMKLREKEAKLTHEQVDGLDFYAAGKATLNMVFDRYIQGKQSLKRNTKANYLYTYDHWVRNSLGKLKIADIKYSDVKYFYNQLIHDEGLKTATVDNVHTVLHPTFEMAVRDDIIRKNPTDGVMAELKKNMGKNKGVRHALTLEQQRAFLNYVKDHPVFGHWYPLFIVFFGTGCRLGEVIGLRWEDLDFKNRLISINHSAIYLSHGKETDWYISTPKTEAGMRVIPMMDAVYQAFKDEQEFQKEHGCNIDVVDGMSGFVFRNKDGKMLNRSVINLAIKRIYEAYNAEELVKAKRQKRRAVLIPHFSCHHIRHTFCTRFCENETNLKVIQSVMGHANIETTMDIYAEATELKKQEAVKALEQSNHIF